MDKANKDRIVIQIIKELATELDLEVHFLCYNWLVRIQKNEVVKHIMGYDWELNSSTAQLIAKDKSACYETLLAQHIPAVEHQLFLSPQFQNYIGEKGSWKQILNYTEQHQYKVVCKSNIGTGGNEVYKINNQLQLETVVHELFSKYRGICLCPFYDITAEYRVILLKGEVQLIYAKERPSIIGNGINTLVELINEKYGQLSFEDVELQKINTLKIPPNGEKIELGWKHNLAKGAKPSIIQEGKLKDSLSALANQTANSINIQFASIDIIACKDELLVMEINSGVMMENFAQESKEHYQIAKEIYKNALVAMTG
jgi:glutathione synthase/RimK-type ligase-like ATP-grasp enzyme